MENFERIQKLGKGNFGDVLLVERLTDKAVRLMRLLAAICTEADRFAR